MLAVIEAFKIAHQLSDVTVVADAGMVSEANKKAIEAAGLWFILGVKIRQVPYVVQSWRDTHPDQAIADGQIFTQLWPASSSDQRRNHAYYYQYKSDRARRSLRGSDEQVAKAEKAVTRTAPVKRNRFVTLRGGERRVNSTLVDKARNLAGLKAYVTNLVDQPAEFIIGAYHRLWHIEKRFRMSKHDLQARPIYARKQDSIEAHLTVVFGAVAVIRFIEDRTGWSIKKFVRTTRRYRTVQLSIGQHVIPAEESMPGDLRTVLALIN